MKTLKFILLLVLPLSLFSQSFQENAPWMKGTSFQKKGKITLNDISTSAEKYFNTIDRFKKGSGLKPFERWKYHWSFYTKSDGTIAPAADLWKAWEEKNTMGTTSTMVDNSNWVPIGPNSSSNTYSSSTLKSSGQGRVNAIAVDPNNSNTYYIGAPAGGIWKSTDAGINWTPLSDYLPQIGVSGIAIHPANSDIIYIATGDDDAGDSYAVGVMKSTDGGTTWNTTGTISANSMNEIYIDPSNPETVTVATNAGIYKTTDGGTNWVQKLSANVLDIKMKPGDATTWYAVTSSTFYKSTDSGETYATVNLPGLTGSTRLTFDVTLADPNYIYIVSAGGSSAFNGIYKSTDSGTSFTKTSETSDIFNGSTQAWYDLALTVSSTDKDIVYVGVLDIFKSTNGGDSFAQLNDWRYPDRDSYTHADIHFLRFIDGKFFAGTDGGIYVSTNEGVNFTDLTNTLGISQFYKISVSPQNSNNVVGGIQDNGGMAYNENKWRNYHGGDGMEGNAHPTEPNTHYGFIQYGGTLYKTTDGGKTKHAGIGKPSSEGNGRWVTPMTLNSVGDVYAGYGQLYKLVNNAWVKISDFRNSNKIYNIEIDPREDNNIFVTKESSLYRSTNTGANFTQISFPGGTINGVEISNNDSNVAWVVTSGAIYKSINILDASPTFTDITGNLPSESKLVVKHHARSGNNTIYVGTALGVYFINDDITAWEAYDTNLPHVAVRDLDINEEDAKLYAGTYGRGVFVSDIPRVLPANDVRLLSITEPANSINCNTSGSITAKINVKNQGTAVINAITLNYSIDGGTNTPFSWTGTLSPDQTTVITIPTINTTKGNHTLNVEAIIADDAYSSNNIGTTTFKINEFNTTPTTINTFEASSDDLLIETFTSGSPSSTELWQRGVPSKTLLNTVSSGTMAYVTGLSGNHPDATTSYLYTNCYDLTLVTNPVLKFKMSFDIELDWDYMLMEYSTDTGANWTILGTAADANWYNSAATTNSTNESTLPGKQWTGLGEAASPLGDTNATLHDYSYDLAAFTNQTSIIFRFKFISDAAVNEEGVLIDDLVIDGVLPVDEFSSIKGLAIYPNPSASIFNINWQHGSTFSVSVYDVTGKLILERKNTSYLSNHFELDMKNYVRGLYFAKITVDGNQVTKKIILK
ncbi:MAG: T9SS type A sorting domain-containing protein [Polaribacter sp.]|nr:T9SS type A sorting domain-containing protein [Polaribacter sp.]